MRKVYQKAIMQRWMSAKELETFEETYKDQLYKSKRVFEPTAKDIRAAAHFAKVLSYSEAAKDLGVSPYYVMSAVGRVYAFKK